MTELRVQNLSLSLDGYAAGPDQSPDHPLGVSGELLHTWMVPEDRQRAPVDERFVTRFDEGMGATIMGRNMFGPVRGPWEGADEWRGWWGEDPPSHHDVFVGRAVRVGGGAATVQQYLRADLIDELHLVVVPVLLQAGERLFENLGGALEGWRCVEFAPSRTVTHVRLRRPRRGGSETMGT